MSSMFEEATSFDQPLNNWDVSNVTTMSFMFQGATSFDQTLSEWNVTNVNNMNGMFTAARNFNQDLSSWCVSQFSDKPINFDTDAVSWTLPRPAWGTCPDDEVL